MIKDILSARVFLIMAMLLWLPIFLAGLLLLTIGVIWTARNSSVSVTAYVPLAVRWVLHETGKREDAEAERIMLALPGISSFLIDTAIRPELWCMRELDWVPAGFTYPIRRPVSGHLLVNQRTTFFDDVIDEYGSKAKQVVLLGEGWGSRAFSGQDDPQPRVYEVDRAEMLSRKIESLNRSSLDYSHIQFVQADLNRDRWEHKLLRSGLNPGQPTLVMMEGVLPYLDPNIVRKKLGPFCASLGSESAIAFDFLSAGSVHHSFIQRIPGFFGEPWRFGLETEPSAIEQVENLLDVWGLNIEKYVPHGDPSHSNYPVGGFVLAKPGS